MNRIVYVNGRYLPEDAAAISIFDRGFLFADAVYEVTAVLEGALVSFHEHMERLTRSLQELHMPMPGGKEELLAIHRQLLLRNDVREGLVYMQVSRGVAERDFTYTQAASPSLVAFTQEKRLVDNPLAERGVRVITAPDQRWGRRDIKTTQLLYSSLVKTEAMHRRADDAWLVDSDTVTEGASSNAYIVDHDGTVITHPLSTDILHGITRSAVLDCARQAGIAVCERPFTVAEAKQSAEAFLTGASNLVVPVVAIDDQQLGDGIPGPITTRLRQIYLAEARRHAVA